LGARLTGAFPIIAVDIIEHKLELARKFGATHIVNAKDGDPVEAIRDITHGGVCYAFEAAGNEQALVQAYRATSRGGTTITIGLHHPDRQFVIPAVSMVVEERTIKGSYMGSSIPTRDVPRLIDLYQGGLLPVEMLISRTISLSDINSGLEALRKGEVVRQLIDVRKGT
jgi:alcohol dehydrogenase